MNIIKNIDIENTIYSITIKGDNNNPLIRASDIAKILDLSNINKNLNDYDNTEKIILNEKTNGGNQDINYLTEKGLKNLLSKSKKINAKKLLEDCNEIFKYFNDNYIKNNKITYENKNILYIIEKENKDLLINFNNNYNNYIHYLNINNITFNIIFEKIFDDTNDFYAIFILSCLKIYNISDNIYSNINNNILNIINYILDTNKIINNKLIINKISNEINEISNEINELKINNDINDFHNELIENNEINQNFNKFISECFLISKDYEESTENIIGQYRIWSKKASEEIFHSFHNYLKIRFKHMKLKIQDQSNVIYGFQGLKLKNINYQKKYNNIIENFIFDICYFSPSGKVLFKNLLESYIEWKVNNNILITNNEKEELKNFLKNHEYVLQSNVYVNKQNGVGYYGIYIKNEKVLIEKKPHNGKIIQKIDYHTNEVISVYDTIAKASDYEKISTSTLSRHIKNKKILDNSYYFSIKI